MVKQSPPPLCAAQFEKIEAAFKSSICLNTLESDGANALQKMKDGISELFILWSNCREINDGNCQEVCKSEVNRLTSIAVGL